MNKIGGEFQIDPQLLRGNQQYSEPLWSSGRSAFQYILQHIVKRVGKGTVYLPDYICESVIEAVRNVGMLYQFYPLNDSLKIDTTWLINSHFKSNDAIVVINYFGLLDLFDSIRQIREIAPMVTIVEDDVQAYWEFLNESDADYKFTSLRKTFPVPDGALIKSKYVLSLSKLLPSATFSDKKIVGGLLKEFGVEDSLYLKYFDMGEELLNKTTQVEKASEYTSMIMGNLDLSNYQEKRKENTLTIIDECKKADLPLLIPYEKKSTALFVPILVNDRDRVRRTLFKQGIFLPVHWPVYSEHMLGKGRELYSAELSIIVDHRYNTEDMKRIVRAIKEAQRFVNV